MCLWAIRFITCRRVSEAPSAVWFEGNEFQIAEYIALNVRHVHAYLINYADTNLYCVVFKVFKYIAYHMILFFKQNLK